MLTSFDNRFHITLLRRIAIKNTRRKKNSGNGTISCGINWPDVKVGRALAAAGGLRRREKGWNVDGSKAGFVRIYVCANERSLCWSVKRQRERERDRQRQREKYCLQSSWHGNVRFVSCIIFVIFFCSLALISIVLCRLPRPEELRRVGGLLPRSLHSSSIPRRGCATTTLYISVYKA